MGNLLEISDIRAYGYTGALPEETTLGQWFRVDLALWLDLSLPGQSDQLTDTYDYRKAIAVVHDLIRHRPYKLIEALAHGIATTLLTTDDRLHRVEVKLTKLTPPIPDFTGQIAVTMGCDRGECPTPPPQTPQKAAPPKT